jgi:four helix bundle protein
LSIEKTQGMNAEQLRARTKELAIRIIRLCQAVPTNGIASVISKQLVRCGTAVGANYRAACRARSRADFVAKLAIVEEEVDECSFWIELLIESGLMRQELVAPLLLELNELTAIISASRKTARTGTNRQSTIANRQ